MRTLAIDHGGKRVGLAMSDQGGRYATPLEILPNDHALLDGVVKLIVAEDVERVVVGLPLNMDGTIGPSAKPVLAFAKSLASRTSVALLFVDERLSSFDAEQQLITQKRAGQKLTRQMKKDRLDALAAASFLRAFLDGELVAIDPAKIARR